MRDLEQVCLSVEEVEAIRLKDMEGLEQGACAAKMCVSRPTFHRVLASARGKLADALIHGKAMRIEGGEFGFAQNRFRCSNDDYEWEVPFDSLRRGRRVFCPVCANEDIQSVPAPFLGGGWGRGFHGSRGHW
jgi:predicted DNA-binding protein (UPF0251 family)